MPSTEQTIEIRAARPTELGAVSALIAAGFERSLAADYDATGRVAFRMYSAERAIALRLAAGALGLVALERDAIVGYAEVQGRHRHLAGRDHLSLLFVDPMRQRSGIARSLVAEIVRQLGDLPRQPARLTVNAAPGAVPAYRRLGFVAVGPLATHEGIRAVPMILQLRAR